MSADPGPLPPDKEEDPLAEATRAPLSLRLGGAALFLATAVIGIATLRACRGQKAPASSESHIEAR